MAFFKNLVKSSPLGFAAQQAYKHKDKIKDFLLGKEAKTEQLSLKSPEQQQLMKLIKEGIESGTGPFAEIFNFNPEQFKEGVSNPVIKQFQEEVLPGLQHKFIANNQLMGSSFNKAQAKAGTDLQSKLAELMYGAQQQAGQNKLAGAQAHIGTQTFENLHHPETEGALQGFIKGVGQGIGKAGSAAIAG